MPQVPYISTIESKGWSLYDANTDVLQLETWEQREARGPVRAVEQDNMYMFAPQPQPGQTLREAYSVTKGVGPCLHIQDPRSPEYRDFMLTFSTRIAVFTRFVLVSGIGVYLTSPIPPGMMAMDKLVLAPDTAQATFERDFYIITPQELRAEVDYRNAHLT